MSRLLSQEIRLVRIGEGLSDASWDVGKRTDHHARVDEVEGLFGGPWCGNIVDLEK